MEFFHDNEDIVSTNDIPGIFQLLYRHNEIQSIITFLRNHEIINEVWSYLLCLFLACITDDKLPVIVEAMERLVIPYDNDEANSVCLQLAVKLLEYGNGSASHYRALYESLIDKCTNKNVLMLNGANSTEETFLTSIITNSAISEDTVIYVLNSNSFSIDQQNSSLKSPLDLAIEFLKCDVVKRLFQLRCARGNVVEAIGLLYGRKREEPAQSDKIDSMLQILKAEVRLIEIVNLCVAGVGRL